MEKLFLASCPSCQYQFPCHYEEMRHAGVKLFCARCHHRFLPEEAGQIIDPPPGEPQ
jgi:hypothetical protein